MSCVVVPAPTLTCIVQAGSPSCPGWPHTAESALGRARLAASARDYGHAIQTEVVERHSLQAWTVLFPSASLSFSFRFLVAPRLAFCFRLYMPFFHTVELLFLCSVTIFSFDMLRTW